MVPSLEVSPWKEYKLYITDSFSQLEGFFTARGSLAGRWMVGVLSLQWAFRGFMWYLDTAIRSAWVSDGYPVPLYGCLRAIPFHFRPLPVPTPHRRYLYTQQTIV